MELSTRLSLAEPAFGQFWTDSSVRTAMPDKNGLMARSLWWYSGYSYGWKQPKGCCQTEARASENSLRPIWNDDQ